MHEYLEKIHLPKHIWLCEDATGINAKIEFHPATNQLVGIVLPLDSKTGLPQPFTYLASSAEAIEKNATQKMSSLVYMVLALPLKPGIPPFVLQVFGTDNKFRAENVALRLEHTSRVLKKYV